MTTRTSRSRALLEDTRQQADKHRQKHEWWASEGVPVVRTKLVCGDYMLVGGTVSVDTKKDMYEVYGNLTQQHERFKRECVLARDIGITLVVLVENTDGIASVEDVARWKEEPAHFKMRQRKNARARFMTGGRLARAMETMSQRYGVGFAFCDPSDAAERVLSILGYYEGGGAE